jgi:hypothetical protein
MMRVSSRLVLGVKARTMVPYINGLGSNHTLALLVPSNGMPKNCNQSYCGSCSTAGQTSLSASIVAFCCCLVLIITSGLRFRKDADNVILKLVSMLCSLVGLFCLVIGMAVWSTQCVNKLSSDYSYALGPGFNCAIVSFILAFVSFVVHLFTPTGSGTEPTLKAPLA